MNERLLLAVLAAVLVLVGAAAAVTGLFWPLDSDNPLYAARYAICGAAFLCFSMAAFVAVKGPSIVASSKR